jgi:hypothetical protein
MLVVIVLKSAVVGQEVDESFFCYISTFMIPGSEFVVSHGLFPLRFTTGCKDQGNSAEEKESPDRGWIRTRPS